MKDGAGEMGRPGGVCSASGWSWLASQRVSSLQTRGPQPGLRGGGSRRHSSGGVGSEKSNTSQVRWAGGPAFGEVEGPAQWGPSPSATTELWALLELSQSKWSGVSPLAFQQLRGDLTSGGQRSTLCHPTLRFLFGFLGNRATQSSVLTSQRGPFALLIMNKWALFLGPFSTRADKVVFIFVIKG